LAKTWCVSAYRFQDLQKPPRVENTAYKLRRKRVNWLRRLALDQKTSLSSKLFMVAQLVLERLYQAFLWAFEGSRALV
jgi:hypothetical protein